MEAGGRLRVKSALNPILWLCAIISGPAAVGFSFKVDSPTYLIVMAYLPVVTAICGYVYFMIYDPDKLQSEEYQLKKMSLEMIEQKGVPEPIPNLVEQAVENPQLRQLESIERLSISNTTMTPEKGRPNA
jgi:hypothetical protein